MQFTTPCFVRVTCPAEWQVLLAYCKRLGYSVDPNRNPDFPAAYVIADGHLAYPALAAGMEDRHPSAIDCGADVELFKALAAMTDAHDGEQWFTNTCGDFCRCTMHRWKAMWAAAAYARHYRHWRKATPEEVRAYLRKCAVAAAAPAGPQLRSQVAFRAKRTDTGDWVYGYYVEDLAFDDTVHFEIIDYRGYCYDVNPATLGVYVGKTDCLGRKIFVGDRYITGPRSLPREVIWDSTKTRFVGRNSMNDVEPVGIDPATEVIGTVHDARPVPPAAAAFVETLLPRVVAFLGSPYIYQSGDLEFHRKMLALGLRRDTARMSGLPARAILTTESRYWLADYTDADTLGRGLGAVLTYTIDDFIAEIKKLQNREK